MKILIIPITLNWKQSRHDDHSPMNLSPLPLSVLHVQALGSSLFTNPTTKPSGEDKAGVDVLNMTGLARLKRKAMVGGRQFIIGGGGVLGVGEDDDDE
ncbi:hypothetical protein RJT34_28596 [Clitoria ternatea]|uniref:Uncharacterized protein n=1 Tax=Clitoria ternatea TaxID=43366 RepID=A0AAN9FB37_CLITE